MYRFVAIAALLAAVTLPSRAQSIECTNGIAVLPDVGSYDCSNIDLVGYMSPAAFGLSGSPSTDHNDIWGWTDPVSGIEYALVGTKNGLGFVDLSNPSQPRLIGKLPTTSVASSWRDVKVYRDHAYIVADSSPDHGIQVFNLMRLGEVTDPPVLFTADTNYQGIGSAHNIVINEDTGFAYAVGARRPTGSSLPGECDARGFHVVDIRDPMTPSFVSCFSDASREADPYVGPGYTHDAQCVIYQGPDADYQGRELCFGSNEDVVTTFDVTNKNDVRIISQGEYPRDVYTHQGWLTSDQRYFLINDEIDERQQQQSGETPSQRTIVMDMQDLDAPDVAFIYDSGLPTIDHNLYVRGRYVFSSNYESGLRILDLDAIDSGTITEVAFFDTYPQGESVRYNGNWSNYPYFESGIVVANDINNGLFVLRPSALMAVNAEAPPQAMYSLSDPAPNPATGNARLTLSVDEPQQVHAELFDVAGRRVATVFDGAVAPGEPVVLTVERGSLPSAIYVVRVVGERFEASRRLVLTR